MNRNLVFTTGRIFKRDYKLKSEIKKCFQNNIGQLSAFKVNKDYKKYLF